MSGLPRVIGSVHTRTPTQLAEAAIDEIAGLQRHGVGRRVLAYEVGLDLAGRVVVDRMGNTPPSELLMACTYRSDPDDLADEIRTERDARGCEKPPRRVVVGRASSERRRQAA